jgi:hypothetical protein
MSWRPILCLIKYHAIKSYGRVEVKLHAFLTFALGGGEWSASHPQPLQSCIFFLYINASSYCNTTFCCVLLKHKTHIVTKLSYVIVQDACIVFVEIYLSNYCTRLQLNRTYNSLCRMWYTGLCWVVRGLKRQLQLTDRRMLWLKEQYLQLYFEECCCGPMTADAIRVGNICL